MSSGIHNNQANLVKRAIDLHELRHVAVEVKNPQFGPEDPRRYFNDGETIVFDLATKQFLAAPAGGGGANVLNDLTDVTAAPTDNHVLKFNSGSGLWENELVSYTELTNVPSTFTPSSHDLAYHSDVTIVPPNDNEVLTFNSGTAQWEGRAAQLPSHALGEHNDTVFAPAAHLVVKRNPTNTLWIAGNVNYSELTNLPTSFPPDSHNLAFHSDVSATAPTNGFVLTYNGGSSEWEPQATQLADHGLSSHSDVNPTLAPLANQVLTYDIGNNRWDASNPQLLAHNLNFHTDVTYSNPNINLIANGSLLEKQGTSWVDRTWYDTVGQLLMRDNGGTQYNAFYIESNTAPASTLNIGLQGTFPPTNKLTSSITGFFVPNLPSNSVRSNVNRWATYQPGDSITAIFEYLNGSVACGHFVITSSVVGATHRNIQVQFVNGEGNLETTGTRRVTLNFSKRDPQVTLRVNNQAYFRNGGVPALVATPVHLQWETAVFSGITSNAGVNWVISPAGTFTYQGLVSANVKFTVQIGMYGDVTGSAIDASLSVNGGAPTPSDKLTSFNTLSLTEAEHSSSRSFYLTVNTGETVALVVRASVFGPSPANPAVTQVTIQDCVISVEHF